jgi:hypothetical protein
MGVAVDILTYLDKQPGLQVKNTGWKDGFGLEVAVWIPIQSDSTWSAAHIVAELQTDGDELCIRRGDGSRSEFQALFDLVVEFLNGYTPDFDC